MNIKKERAMFEDWCGSQSLATSRLDGEYIHDDTWMSWEAWRTRAKLIAQDRQSRGEPVGWVHKDVLRRGDREERLFNYPKYGIESLAVYATPHPAEPVKEPSDEEISQFLADVMTAAGLVAHGKQCKELGKRLAESGERLRTAVYRHGNAEQPSVPGPRYYCGTHNELYVTGWNDCRAEMINSTPPADALSQQANTCAGCGKKASEGWALYCVGCVESINAEPGRDAELRRFLDVAAGEGYVFDGVDAGDLYLRLFPAAFDAATQEKP